MLRKILYTLQSTKARFLIILGLAFFLRFWQVAQVPPAPYWEEVALGYDAYSILKTGQDHHGKLFPIVAFESFGDYKPSLYFYFVAVSEAFLGLSVLAVRFPSILSGVVIVYLVGKIVQELQRMISEKNKLEIFWPEISMLLVTFSPWFLFFSRGGWEVNLATALILSGIYFGLKNWDKFFHISEKNEVMINFILSIIFFVLSMYAYHSARIIAPLLGVVIALPLLQKWKVNLSKIFALLILSVVLISPILFSLGKVETTQRFAETSAFPNFQLVQQSNQLIAEDGNTFISRIIHHRWLFYSELIIKNILSHFDFSFLFLSGDMNPRHSIQFFGQLFHVDIIFFFLGLIILWKKSWKMLSFLFLWLLISLLPASITTAVPHALRTLPGAVVFPIITALGILTLPRLLKGILSLKLTSILISFIYLLEIVVFFHYYLSIYPKKYAAEWQFGYQELIQTVQQNMRENESVYISRAYGRPAMYYWFYSKTDPQLVQAESFKHGQDGKEKFEDQGEFLKFNNINFVTGLNGTENGLIATIPEDLNKFPEAKIITTVQDLVGKDVWVVIRN